MRVELLEIVRCPASGERLTVEQTEYRDGQVYSGWLLSENKQHRYPIRNYIPRFVPESNYADNFGMQWNRFRKTQLDSHSGQPISANRFWKVTGWSPESVDSKWVLDVGCGAGRFAEVALRAGAHVVAVDYSSAVDACQANLAEYPNLHVVQGDIYSLPVAKESFPFVYSLGVLQHTPDVARAFAALPPVLAPGGHLAVDFYWKRIRTIFQAKYAVRPITRRMSPEKLYSFLVKTVPLALSLSQALGHIPLLGRFLQRTIPVANYTGIYPLTKQQLREWALLDTFDSLAPRHDHPQTATTVQSWLKFAGLVDVEVFHHGHLVGRGRKHA